MTSYNLRRISVSTFEITSSRRKVGFVNKCPAGYVARIGQHCETAATAEEAFRRVAAKALGYATPADLAAHNQAVRAAQAPMRAIRKQQRAAARYVVDQALNHGNFDPLLDALTKVR